MISFIRIDNIEHANANVNEWLALYAGANDQ